jgi:hydrogenase/urease accessory protein HupE
MKRLIILIGLVFTGNFLSAHESRPLFIEIIEQESGIFLLQYKIPSSIPDFNLPEVKMPEGFEALGSLATYSIGQGLLKSQQYKSTSPINGLHINVQYPVINPSVSSIVKVRLQNGLQFQAVLGPDELIWKIPEEEDFWGVARQYSVLGVKHILEGWDHLLFLICLIIVAGTGKKLLITITGFTLAHSITLALSALSIVQLPIPPVEAVIALSVVFLATEIAVQNKNSLTYKYPILVSSSFGLLHGFGFAAVLGEIGLPQQEVITSLLFFNIGVELGQVLFIAGVLMALWIGRWIMSVFWIDHAFNLSTRAMEKVTVYAVGCVASYWVVERVAGFF